VRKGAVHELVELIPAQNVTLRCCVKGEAAAPLHSIVQACARVFEADGVVISLQRARQGVKSKGSSVSGLH
jgi:hypothetical protein